MGGKTAPRAVASNSSPCKEIDMPSAHIRHSGQAPGTSRRRYSDDPAAEPGDIGAGGAETPRTGGSSTARRRGWPAAGTGRPFAHRSRPFATVCTCSHLFAPVRPRTRLGFSDREPPGGGAVDREPGPPVRSPGGGSAPAVVGTVDTGPEAHKPRSPPAEAAPGGCARLRRGGRRQGAALQLEAEALAPAVTRRQSPASSAADRVNLRKRAGHAVSPPAGRWLSMRKAAEAIRGWLHQLRGPWQGDRPSVP